LPFVYAHKEDIQSLEINGHTSSEWGKSNFTDTYFKNGKLSLNRSYETMSYLFREQKKSRRVSFKVILK
jgi:outer membrane protein OmpA-like peptidoglycan-associated protein